MISYLPAVSCKRSCTAPLHLRVARKCCHMHDTSGTALRTIARVRHAACSPLISYSSTDDGSSSEPADDCPGIVSAAVIVASRVSIAPLIATVALIAIAAIIPVPIVASGIARNVSRVAFAILNLLDSGYPSGCSRRGREGLR